VESLTSRAERAVLGAMILDRALVSRLNYLEWNDFSDERLRAVLTAVRFAAAEPGASDRDWPAAVSAQAERFGGRRLIVDLVDACEVTAHGPAYAALVIEASLGRRLAAQGQRLAAEAGQLAQQAARAVTANGAGGPSAAELAAHLSKLGDAFNAHAARTAIAAAHPGRLPQNPLRAFAVPYDTWKRREDHVLAALLTRHPESGQVLASLPAAAFGDPYRQALFRAVRRLDAAGQPVDPLTADWEAARHGIPPAGRTDSYATIVARTTSEESPAKTAAILRARLDRGTNGVTVQSTQPAVQPNPAPRHASPRPYLVQPPPGPANRASPEPRN
jgi:replicative DNA helicase